MYSNFIKKLSLICLFFMSLQLAFAGSMVDDSLLSQGETYIEQDWAPQIIWQVYPDSGEMVTLLKVLETDTKAIYKVAPGTGKPANTICAKYPDKCVKIRH